MKKYIITEAQLAIIKQACLPNTAVVQKKYVINPDKVLIVKKYLDNGFKRGSIERIGADGFPCIVPMFGMLSSTGEILKNLGGNELLDLLEEKFKKMFSDTDERKKFLGQVMRDWYNNKIGLYGSLSVNHL